MRYGTIALSLSRKMVVWQTAFGYTTFETVFRYPSRSQPGGDQDSRPQYAVEQLRYVGANIIGVVINGIDNRSLRYGYYYRSYYYKQYKYYGTNGKGPGKGKKSTGKFKGERRAEEARVEE